MTVQRHEEHKEVVTYNNADVRPGDGWIQDTGPVMATQTETITGDPHDARRSQVFKFEQAIYMLFGILEGLLGIRFVLGLFGANPGAGFAQFIYGITAPFLAPFVGLFGQPTFEGVIFEWNALVAILVYALLAWVIVKLMVLGLGDSRRGTYTATSSRIDRV